MDATTYATLACGLGALALAVTSSWRDGNGLPPAAAPPMGWRWRTQPNSAGSARFRGAVTAVPEPEVLELPSKGGSKALGVVLIPGNPGIPQYYVQFGEQLQDALRDADCGEAAVYAIGYTNFPTQSAPSEEVASIDQEVERLGPVLLDLAKAHQERGLILVGHSIGAWCVTQHLLGAVSGAGLLANARIPVAVLAAPYLEFDGSPWSTQWVYDLVLSQPPGRALVHGLARLIVALPEPLQRQTWAQLADAETQQDLEVTLNTFGCRPHHLVNMAMMGRTEFVRLDPKRHEDAGLAELKPLAIARNRPAILAIYGSDDHWGPEAHAAVLRALFEESAAVSETRAEVSSVGDLQHSFVLRPHQSRLVAEMIAGFVAKCVHQT